MLWYEKVHQFVQGVVPRLRKTRQANLAWLTAGVVPGRGVCLTELARALPGPYRLLYRVKRLWRFVDKPQVRPIEVSHQVIAWLVACLGGRERVPLIVDYTSIKDNYQTLWVAIPFRGRGLPGAAPAFGYAYPELTGSLNQAEEGFLQEVASGLPQGMKPLLIADRGFGRTSLVAFLLGQGWHFVIRVNGKVRVKHQGRPLLLEGVKPGKGQRRWLPSVSYSSRVQVDVAVAWGGQEPCYLVTSLRSWAEAVGCYRKRMWIEEMFRDSKWRLGMENTRLTSSARIERLLLGLVLAFLFLVLLGIPLAARWWPRWLSWGKGSPFYLGLLRMLSPPLSGQRRWAT